MLDDEAISLFRAEIKGVKPLKQDRFVPPRATKKKNQIAAQRGARAAGHVILFF